MRTHTFAHSLRCTYPTWPTTHVLSHSLRSTLPPVPSLPPSLASPPQQNPCRKELCRRFYRVVNGTTTFDSRAVACDVITDKDELVGLQRTTGSIVYPGLCMCSNTCVVDSAVYARTRGRLGLDFCKVGMNDEVVVLRDDFEPRGAKPIMELSIFTSRQYAYTATAKVPGPDMAAPWHEVVNA